MLGSVAILVAADRVDAQGPVAARSTAPGTIVANTAELGWTMAGTPGATRSNTDRLTVAERLDIRLAPGPDAPAGSDAIAVDLTNQGSGTEAFVLAAASPDDPARALTIVVDVDRDGRCDPAIDRALVDGRTTPLAAGDGLRLLVCDSVTPVRVVARADTGSGTPGTVFAGAGDAGSDAVVGPTGAAAALVVGDTDGSGPDAPAPVLVKSQSVLASDGSARAAAGAVITYTLAARFDGATIAAEIEDPLPAGTTIVPGSLALDDLPLSDAADADAGEVAARIVRVRLGDVPAGTDHRVTFAVTVNP